MRKALTGLLVALLLAAAFGLVSMASSGTAAGPSQYQYKKPSLTLSVTNMTSTSFTLHLAGTGYNSGSEPGGTVSLACGGKMGSTCGPPPPPWPSGPTDASGSFSFDVGTFDCGSNVKAAVATDVDGVKSNRLKGAC